MKESNNSLKLFLQEEYAFRRNLLSGKIEFCERKDAESINYRTLAREDMNSIVLAAEEAMPEMKGLRQRVETIVYSRMTPDYDPIREWLQALPEWDQKNHVDALLDRLPGLRAEQRYWLHVWLRSMVAHWLGADELHANELVPTIIGPQGCGKSTFCRLLLPEHLREYFLDHVNLANKFDKEMALTNNLLVNVDELDQVRRSQQAELKQLLSKSRVNGRPIYGRAQDDRRRYASFVATTNNLHPLHDPTGSRRFLCIEIPFGKLIDNQTSIDYGQLYAQLLSEFRAGERYWLTEEETRCLQRANAPYQSTLDMERMVDTCFRHPAGDEPCRPLVMSDIVDIVARQYPFVRPTQASKVQLGLALSARGYEHTRDNQARHYYVVPIDES
jgi:predicted P-loop ATPase